MTNEQKQNNEVNYHQPPFLFPGDYLHECKTEKPFMSHIVSISLGSPSKYGTRLLRIILDLGVRYGDKDKTYQEEIVNFCPCCGMSADDIEKEEKREND